MINKCKKLITGKLVFLDLEADQHKQDKTSKFQNYLLQIGCIKTNNLEVVESYFEEVYCPWYINYHVAYVINKPCGYFNNEEFINEKEAYLKLLKFIGDSEVVVHGDYDQKILDDIAERYNLQKIKVIDVSGAFRHKKLIPSISKLIRAFGIDDNKFEKHSSIDDAKALLEIFKSCSQLKNEEELEYIKQLIILEHCRPYNYRRKWKKATEEEDKNIELANEHYYIFDLYNSKYIKQEKNSEVGYHNIKHSLFVISNKGEVIKSSSDKFNKVPKAQVKQITNNCYDKVINLLIKYKNNFVLISNHNLTKRFETFFKKEYRTSFPTLYTIPWQSLIDVMHLNSECNVDQLIKVVNEIENNFYNKETKRFDLIKH